MSAPRYPAPRGWTGLWLLHDDCAPEPEALERLMAEAESRPSASILGPGWCPGMSPAACRRSATRSTGQPEAVSLIQPDSGVDQGQHDQIRADVFFVNTAGMLVRRMALPNVGGFDERDAGLSATTSICWRHAHHRRPSADGAPGGVCHLSAVFFDTGRPRPSAAAAT